MYSEEGGVLLSGFGFTSGVATGSNNLNGFAILAQPFDITSWFCLFFVMFLFALVFTVAELLENSKRIEITKKRIFIKTFKNLANLFATLSGESISKFSEILKRTLLKHIKAPFSKLNPFSKFDFIVVFESKSRISQEILIWFWKSAVLTIPVYYSSFIFAKIISQPTFVVESFDDIGKLPEIEIAFWKGTSICFSAIYPKLAVDSPELFFQIRSNQKRILKLPRKELLSEKTLDDVLDGKKILYGPYTMTPEVLSDRFKNKKMCGFYQSRPHYTLMVSMLFNKNLNSFIKNLVNKK